MAQTLNELRAGDSAVVVKVAGEGAIRRRLLDMGLGKGTALKVEKIAPLGDPIDVLVKGYHLSLRKEEAKTIQVQEVRRG
ncbi:MAG TPA: ferrous iron transport protein A [bacterium]|nr:ferrous iron transport protein A [bacterium]